MMGSMEARAADSRSAHTLDFRTSLLRAAAILALLGVLLLVPVPVDNPAIWAGEASDFLHVPIFAALTYLLARFCFPRQRAVVLIAAACLAVGAEAIQPFFTRSASWRDAIYGLLGVGIAAALLVKSLPPLARMAVILALAAVPLWRTGPTVIDAFHGWLAFPTIASFDGLFATRRWHLRNAQMQSLGDHARLSTRGNMAEGSGGVLIPLVRDWSAYRRLEFDINLAGPPVLFLVSIRTGGKRPQEQAHYDLVERYPPGRHHISIDLPAMQPVGNDIPLELDRIQSLLLIAFDEEPRTVEVSSIRLAK